MKNESKPQSEIKRKVIKGVDPKIIHNERVKVYTKSDADKKTLKKAQLTYEANMKATYGDNWKTSKHNNVPVNVNEKTGAFIAK